MLVRSHQLQTVHLVLYELCSKMMDLATQEKILQLCHAWLAQLCNETA